MDDDSSFTVSRRDVLKALGATAICPLVSGCEFVDAFDDGEVPAETRFSLNDPGLEVLREVGETACYEHGPRPLLLVRVSEEDIAAFDRFCPHQNQPMGDCGGNSRPAEFDHEDGILTCQWHQSQFDVEGNFVDGPDPQITPDLPSFPVEFDSDTEEGTVFSP